MAEERAKRRLAAILAADVVGYSRLMQLDEAGTLATLKARRTEVLQPVVAKHHGRTVKLMGDGVLVEFASAVNAVECAVELQVAMDAANQHLPDDRRIVLRVGINLGDVMVEGSDLYGDGVNIAARVEAIAEPGSVFVSQTVFNHVRGKVPFEFEDLGEQSLKNMAEPVRVYRVSGLTAVTSDTFSRSAQSSKPSIAVLPFTNMSADPDQQYLSDGITEDIITELARFRQMSVISRNSSFQYRGKAVDTKRVGRELGVQYLVEGSIRKTGSRIRITAQLIDTGTGNHLWAERYDRDLQEIFALQDEVVRTIVGTLIGRMQAASAEQAKRTPPRNMAAYDYVLRGNALPVGDPKDEGEARRLYEKAIEIDPEYGLAYALLATTLMQAWFRDMLASAEPLDRILAIANKAVALDNEECVCHMILGWVCLHRRSYDLAEVHYQRAVELNPNKPGVGAHMCELLTYLGRPEEGIDSLERARRLDPYHPTWYWRTLGRAFYTARRYEEAIAAFNRSTILPPWALALVAACHAELGRTALAEQSTDAVLRQQPTFSVRGIAAKEPFKNQPDLEHLVDGLRKAGLPE
jgi:adenylate cyclase